VVDGKQPSGKTKDLYDSAVQKLLDELGLSSLSSRSTGAAKESERARQSVDGDRSIAVGRVKSNAAT
jgi:hypothetical protein